MQRCYHGRTRNSKSNRRIPKICGGSYSIPLTALILAWAAYRQRKLDWLALRVWIALWEIKCWHEARANFHGLPHFQTSQIASALRSPKLPTKRVEAALSALRRLNLVDFAPVSIRISASLDDIVEDSELCDLATRMLTHIGHANAGRGIRMPRRMLVSLMTTQRPRPVYAGVMFALLIRSMLTKRYETYKGCCTASWIALVFGGDPSSVKSARAQLIAEGWFLRLDTPQRVRQKYGEWVTLAIEQPVENQAETEPPAPSRPDETEPPLKNQSLSDEIETNQSLETGASQSRWGNIQPLDLHTPKRRKQLYHAALLAGAIPPTEAHRLTFFAAIAHATRVATRNSCGLLRQLVETPSYHTFISQADENRASAWLLAERANMPLDALTTREPDQNLSDQLIASRLRNGLEEAGFPTESCFALIMTTHEGKNKLAGWTQDRWDRAVSHYQEQGQ